MKNRLLLFSVLTLVSVTISAQKIGDRRITRKQINVALCNSNGKRVSPIVSFRLTQGRVFHLVLKDSDYCVIRVNSSYPDTAYNSLLKNVSIPHEATLLFRMTTLDFLLLTEPYTHPVVFSLNAFNSILKMRLQNGTRLDNVGETEVVSVSSGIQLPNNCNPLIKQQVLARLSLLSVSLLDFTSNPKFIKQKYEGRISASWGYKINYRKYSIALLYGVDAPIEKLFKSKYASNKWVGVGFSYHW